jgi:hypothetical protein
MSFEFPEDWESEIVVDAGVTRGTTLYKRSHQSPVEIKEGPQWFSFERDYGESYGSHEKEFKINDDLRLLDVAKTKSRQAISRYARKNGLMRHCVNAPGESPLEHAWGEGCNEEAAETACAVAKTGSLDGWIAKEWDDETLEGPREIMLCLDKPAIEKIFGNLKHDK